MQNEIENDVTNNEIGWLMDIDTTAPGFIATFNEENNADENGYRWGVGADALGIINKYTNTVTRRGASSPRSVPDIWFHTRIYDMFLLNERISGYDKDSGVISFRNKIMKEWQCLLAAVVLNKLDLNRNGKKKDVDPGVEYDGTFYTGVEHKLSLNEADYSSEYAKVAANHRKSQLNGKNFIIADGMGDADSVILYGASEVYEDENKQQHEIELYLAVSSPTTIVAPAAEGMNNLGAVLDNEELNKWRDKDGDWDFAEYATDKERFVMCKWLDDILTDAIQNNRVTFKSNRMFNVIPGDYDKSGCLYGFINDIIKAQRQNDESQIELKCPKAAAGAVVIPPGPNPPSEWLRKELLPFKFEFPGGYSGHYAEDKSNLPAWLSEEEEKEYNLITKEGIFKKTVYVMKCAPHESVDEKESWSGADNACLDNGYFVPMPLTEKAYELLKNGADYSTKVKISNEKAAEVTINFTLPVNSKREVITQKYSSGLSEYIITEMTSSIKGGHLTGALWPKMNIEGWERYFLHSQNSFIEGNETSSYHLRPLGGKGELNAYAVKQEQGYQDGLSRASDNQLCYWEMKEFPHFLEFGEMQKKDEKKYTDKEAAEGFEILGYVKVYDDGKKIPTADSANTYRFALDFGTSSTTGCRRIGSNKKIELLGENNEDKLNAGMFGAMIPKNGMNLPDGLDVYYANMRASMYFFGKDLFKIPFQSVLHVMRQETVVSSRDLSYVREARLHNPATVAFGTKHSKGVLYSNLKRGDNDDSALVQRYIENITLAAYLDARINDCGKLKLYVSYPAVLGKTVFGRAYRTNVDLTFKKMKESSGCEYIGYEEMTESEAAARFVNNDCFTDGGFVPSALKNLYVVDIGGGSCDIACYIAPDGSDRYATRHVSLYIGARRLFVDSLIMNNPQISAKKEEDKYAEDKYTSLMRMMRLSNASRKAAEYSPMRIDEICNENKRDPKLRHSNIEKLLSIIDGGKTIGEHLSKKYLSPECCGSKKFAVENYMFQMILTTGLGGIFYCIGLMLGGAALNQDETIRIQLTGNGAKIYDWICEEEKNTQEFIKNMLLSGASESNADLARDKYFKRIIDVQYDKTYAKQEVARGLLYEPFGDTDAGDYPETEADSSSGAEKLDIQKFIEHLNVNLIKLYKNEDENGKQRNPSMSRDFTDFTKEEWFPLEVSLFDAANSFGKMRPNLLNTFKISQKDYDKAESDVNRELKETLKDDCVGISALLALISAMQQNMHDMISAYEEP